MKQSDGTYGEEFGVSIGGNDCIVWVGSEVGPSGKEHFMWEWISRLVKGHTRLCIAIWKIYIGLVSL